MILISPHRANFCKRFVAGAGHQLGLLYDPLFNRPAPLDREVGFVEVLGPIKDVFRVFEKTLIARRMGVFGCGKLIQRRVATFLTKVGGLERVVPHTLGILYEVIKILSNSDSSTVAFRVCRPIAK